MSNKSEVIEAITLLGGAFDKPMTPELVKAYAAGLDDIAPGMVLAAAKELLKDSQYFPRISELRKAAKTLHNVSGRYDPEARVISQRAEFTEWWTRLVDDGIDPDQPMSNEDWNKYVRAHADA
jgi:hypothetical protein